MADKNGSDLLVTEGLTVNVLIVEDEVEIASTLKHLLELQNCAATIAHDFEQLKKEIRTDATVFDAIICDMNFDGVRDGENIYAYIRKSFKEIPFIFHSSDITFKEESLVKVDKNLYIVKKPNGISEIYEIINGIDKVKNAKSA